MSLNKYMHPRNRYKFKKPDFNVLAEKYSEFKQYVIDNPKGKPVLDFKNPEAVRVLTICLLTEDFGINVEIPPDRLVPTLPLRLNYVHWIEDITSSWGRKELSGIDIGTGACCVYPVLAISGNQWRFLATEADEVNFTYAKKNIESNNLSDKIRVVKVAENTILEGVIGSTSEQYDFCMCNPPFFADHFEAQGLLSRTPNRPDPKTMSTASPQEGIVQGGEVGFVKQMIEESVFLQDRVRVYSSMLGKKTSLGPLKEILRRHQVPSFATTEFCQGKTMRWGLAWTFDKSVTFPKSEFAMGKKEVKKSVVHVIPTAMGERRGSVYDMVSFLKQVFSELQIHCREGKQTKHFALMTLTAAENTWIHSRRKRRQMMREAAAAAATASATATSETAATGSETSATVSSVTNSEPSDNSAQLSAVTKNSLETSPDENLTESDPTKAERMLKLTEGKDMTNQDTSRAIKRKAEDGGDLEQSSETGEQETGDGPSLKCKKLETEHGENDKATSQNLETDREQDATSDVSEVNPQKRESDSNSSVQNGSKVSDIDAAAISIDDTSTSLAESAARETDDETCANKTETSRPPAQFVLKCHATVRVQGPDLALELTWLDGADIQLMHQLMQCLKNRLAARTNTA